MTKLKEFNLERALAGDPVITRDGRKVLEIYCFNTHISHPVVFLVEDENIQTACKKDGKFEGIDGIRSIDLFMAPQKKTYYVNIYRRQDESMNTGVVFPTREDAIDKKGSDYLKTIEFEVEE